MYVLDVGATPMRRWFVYYGPESLTPIHCHRETYTMVLIVWTAMLLTMHRTRTRQRQDPNHREDTAAQTRAEFHMLLRQQCRADYAATDTWRPPADASWAPRWGRRQNRTRAGWASRWRGLACWHEGQVLWHTDDRYPAAAAAQDDRDEDWLEGHD